MLGASNELPYLVISSDRYTIIFNLEGEEMDFKRENNKDQTTSKQLF